MPSKWVVLSSALDTFLIALLAEGGFLMHALPWSAIGAVLLAAAVFTFLLDGAKSLLFAYAAPL